MFFLSGTLKTEWAAHDQLRHWLKKYFSSRNWPLEESDNGLTARVGTAADLWFRGYVFFCQQVEFDLSLPGVVAYRFKPNWRIIGLAVAMFCFAGAVMIGARSSWQDVARGVVAIALVVPVYSLFMIAHLKSVILRDLKTGARKA